MPIPVLRVTAEPLEDAILVRAAGEIDMSTVDVLRRELDAVREEAAAALLDLPGVTFIDSSGLHLLLDASHDSAVSDWDSSSSGPLRWWSVCSKSVVRPIGSWSSTRVQIACSASRPFAPLGRFGTGAEGNQDGG